jgi:hypothetical protein
LNPAGHIQPSQSRFSSSTTCPTNVLHTQNGQAQRARPAGGRTRNRSSASGLVAARQVGLSAVTPPQPMLACTRAQQQQQLSSCDTDALAAAAVGAAPYSILAPPRSLRPRQARPGLEDALHTLQP